MRHGLLVLQQLLRTVVLLAELRRVRGCWWSTRGMVHVVVRVCMELMLYLILHAFIIWWVVCRIVWVRLFGIWLQFQLLGLETLCQNINFLLLEIILGFESLVIKLFLRQFIAMLDLRLFCVLAKLVNRILFYLELLVNVFELAVFIIDRILILWIDFRLLLLQSFLLLLSWNDGALQLPQLKL